jgi:hypothetical protein
MGLEKLLEHVDLPRQRAMTIRPARREPPLCKAVQHKISSNR